MSEDKPAFQALHEAMFQRLAGTSKRLYDLLPGDSPVRTHWGELTPFVSTHDNEQDDIVLLLNEAFESMEESE